MAKKYTRNSALEMKKLMQNQGQLKANLIAVGLTQEHHQHWPLHEIFHDLNAFGKAQTHFCPRTNIS